MFDALRQFFSQAAPARGETGEPTVSVELATAVLLVEASRADQDIAPEERAALGRILQRSFGLAESDVRQLVATAEDRSRRANDFFAFTHVLNERLTQAQKAQVVEQMWQLAYVDASADPGESHVISRVAGLLHVPHGEYIAAKLRARDARLSAPPGPSHG
jgi:uncharacterized tellurite resistance protein B-like protein